MDSPEEVGGPELDEARLALTLVSHPIHEAEGPEWEYFLERVTVQLLLWQCEFDLLLCVEGHLAVHRHRDTDSGTRLSPYSLVDLFITLWVEHDADSPGALTFGDATPAV